MSFAQKLSSEVRKHMSNLNRMHDERVARAEARAREQLAKAKTNTDREKVKLQLQREKMQAKQELYEAQTATKKAKTAMEKARKEAGDFTIGERVGQAGQSIGRGSVKAYQELTKTKRRPVKRTTKRKVTTSKK